MAGEWIKWCKGLTKKREVIVMASKLKRDRREIAGRLMELWEWCDENLSDSDFDIEGHASLIIGDKALEFVDDTVGLDGFAEAMASPEVHWLIVNEGGRITFPNLARNNGSTAKARLYEAARKAKQRNIMSQSDRDIPGTKSGTRGEEKERREEISNRERPDRRVREDLSPPIDQSQLEISGRGEETKAAERTKPPALPRGEPLDLSRVDWVHVTNMAVALGKRVPPLSENDRRAWLRYAVMADQVLSEDWLMESAESVVLAKVRKGKPTAHLVAILKDRAEAAGIDNETFIGIQRRIEIPKELWKSHVLPVQSKQLVGGQTQ